MAYDLTIAIPTFNRSGYLKALLEKLVPACLGANVEVLVSDNASTDDTVEVAKTFGRYGHFRIMRNENNLGFDRNILRLLAEAGGRFVWLFGDDDSLDLSLLGRLIDLVKNNPRTGLFFLNFGDRLEPPGRAELITRSVSQQEYLDNYLHEATFITLNILNMDVFSRIKLDNECITKEWINLQILINMAARSNEEGRRNLVVENKVIIPTWGTNNYSPDFFWGQFVDRFAFTVDRSAKGLSLQRFKVNFYRLNIRHRFLTIGRDFSDGRVFETFTRVKEYFHPAIRDLVSFWVSLAVFRFFGYARLKQAKDFFVRARR